MREIKFRAWDEKINKMSHPMEFSQDGVSIPNEYFNHEETDLFLRVGRFGVTLMQYTGRKDKNDAEIYEGDIVNAISYWSRDKKYGAIVFQNSSFRIDDDIDNNGWLMCNSRNFEVVGNIYENPELLEKS